MNTFLSILSATGIVLFIVVFFGFCIFIHEFGHLLAAKWQGLHVDKFSIGFGKKLWGFHYKGIEFIVSLLPLGGYVSIPQLEPGDEPQTADKKPLPFATPKARAITAFAGPFFNILFGFVLACVLWIIGVWQVPDASLCLVSDVPVVVPVYDTKHSVNPTEQIVRINGKDCLGAPMPGERTFEGSLYDLCVYWDALKKDYMLTTENDTAITLLVRDPATDDTREVEYHVTLNPEYTAGLRAKDRILAFNGKPLTKGFSELYEACAYNDADMAVISVESSSSESRRDIAFNQLPNSRVEGLKVPFFQAQDPLILGDVLPESPAARAGLQRGDQLIAVNGETILTAQDLLDAATKTTRTTMALLIARHGDTRIIDVVLPADHANITAEQLGLAFIVSVRAVYKDTPAQKAGLRYHDRLLKINGEEVTSVSAVQKRVNQLKDAPITLVVLRDGKELTIGPIHAQPYTLDGKKTYLIGIQMDDAPPKVLAHPTPWAQFTSVFNKTARTLWLLFKPVTNAVTGHRTTSAPVKIKHMSSFVGITTMLWYSVKSEGIRGGLAFILLITFGLAFANLLPLPILDGGHILFAFIEFVIRRRLPTKFMTYISNIFAVLLIALMLYITFNDIMRLPRIRKAYSQENPTLPQDASAPENSHD